MKASFPAAGDELQSAAFLALVEAAQSFDSSRGVGFATLARHRIWGALCDLRREIINRVRPGGSESELVAVRLAKGFQTGGRLIGVEPDEPVGSELEALETFENWIGQLPRLQARRSFRHIYLDGETSGRDSGPAWLLEMEPEPHAQPGSKLAATDLQVPDCATLRQTQKTEHEDSVERSRPFTPPGRIFATGRRIRR